MTIQRAAHITGWSPRMLRYIERTGLVMTARSSAGYRVYGSSELERLRALRSLLDECSIALTDVVFAARLAAHPQLRAAVESWLEAKPRDSEYVTRPDPSHFREYENEKLLAALA